jgi:hypothetical protein
MSSATSPDLFLVSFLHIESLRFDLFQALNFPVVSHAFVSLALSILGSTLPWLELVISHMSWQYRLLAFSMTFARDGQG